MKKILLAIIIITFGLIFISCPDSPGGDNPGTIIVTFNKNNQDSGSTEAEPKTIQVSEPGASITALPTAPSRNDYTFSGWNTKSDGSGTSFDATTPVYASITVYAQWVHGTLVPLSIEFEPIPETAILTPLSTERQINLEVRVSGFTSATGTQNVKLDISSVPQISFSGHEATTTASSGTKTFTVQITYNGATFEAGSATISIIGLKEIPSTCIYSDGTKTTSVKIADGQTAERNISVKQSNITAFYTYVRSADGLNRHYRLIEEIDMSGASNWTSDIGSSTSGFSGTFDGNGYTITGLNNGSYSNESRGMFAYIGSNGVVKNLGLENVTSNGGGRIGGLVGTNNGLVQNCYVSGAVSSLNNGYRYVGGIAGMNNGTIENCYSTANTSGAYTIGGIAGYNNGTVKNCYATGTVITQSQDDAGGVVGENRGIIQNCYATGTVTGISYAGGIAGANYSINATEPALVQNNVALSPTLAVTSTYTEIHRVTGTNNNGTYNMNYARADMTLNDNGTVTPPSSDDPDSLDGKGIDASQYYSASWWTTPSNWYGSSAWDTTIWDISDGKLPTLKNTGGTQNPAITTN